MITNEDAKNYALALIEGKSFGNWQPKGISLTDPAFLVYKSIGERMSEFVEPVSNSRLSASGFTLDLYAPSAWHALCALLLQELYSRFKKGSHLNAYHNVNKDFGRLPLYRGQVRGWDIIPSAWRTPEVAANAGKLLNNYSQVFNEHFDHAPDPIIKSIRPDGLDADHLTGLAQHYALPTNWVDLSFDPLVAVCFASDNTASSSVQPRDLTDLRLQSCAVVYALNAAVFTASAKNVFSFPPGYSLRLYRQKGLFADFGSYPGAENINFPSSYPNPWNWLQQNCQRIFFSRTYPFIEDADELKNHNLMNGDVFLNELANKVLNGKPAGVGTCSSIPPWMDFHSNDQKLIKAVAKFYFQIDDYLRRACLVKF